MNIYDNQVIEGISCGDLKETLSGKSDVFKLIENGQTLYIEHMPTRHKVMLRCIRNYFEPPKSYYHFNENSTCPYIYHAFFGKAIPQYNIENNCKNCLLSCLDKYKIKPFKFTMSNTQFEK